MTSAARVCLTPANPGQFFACCGLLELADRAWGGAEGYFDSVAGDSFVLTPLTADSARDVSLAGLLSELRAATISNPGLPDPRRREELEKEVAELKRAKKSGRKADTTGLSQREGSLASKEAERADLNTEYVRAWDVAKDGALHLGGVFDLALDWHLDDLSGGGRFKTWAGQQTVTSLLEDLKRDVDSARFDGAEEGWLSAPFPCSAGLHLDAVDAPSAIDVGFSFDPLQIGTPLKRGLTDLLAFVGLQRFRPRPAGRNAYAYTLWDEPLVPELASVMASGCVRRKSARTYVFRLFFRTKYLKSFQPATLKGDHL